MYIIADFICLNYRSTPRKQKIFSNNDQDEIMKIVSISSLKSKLEKMACANTKA